MQPTLRGLGDAAPNLRIDDGDAGRHTRGEGADSDGADRRHLDQGLPGPEPVAIPNRTSSTASGVASMVTANSTPGLSSVGR
jgi:hypothetical protein